MGFVWRDYSPEAMGYIENWLDDVAIKSTGLDNGFRDFYEYYWANEDGFVVGQNFWCKVIFENDEPIACIAFCYHECKITIMEFVVKPEKRSQGNGSKVLKQLFECKEIIGLDIQKSEAVIFPNNIASKRAFENAGFKYHHTHEDGDASYYVYDNSFNQSI